MRYFIFFWLLPWLHAFILLSQRQMFKINFDFSDINALILDYLTMEGYPNAAAKFSQEANLQPQQDTCSILARQQIQNCIHGGDIQTAIETLNDLDPEVRCDYSFLKIMYNCKMIILEFTCTTLSTSFLAFDETTTTFIWTLTLLFSKLWIEPLLSDLPNKLK